VAAQRINYTRTVHPQLGERMMEMGEGWKRVGAQHSRPAYGKTWCASATGHLGIQHFFRPTLLCRTLPKVKTLNFSASSLKLGDKIPIIITINPYPFSCGQLYMARATEHSLKFRPIKGQYSSLKLLNSYISL
jgi:hypothetical protein